MSQAILIDALGTLVALEPPGRRLRAELARRFGLQLTESEASSAIGAEIAYYRRHLDEGRDERSLRELRGRCASVLREALDAAPLPLEELTAALLASLQFTAYPDAAPALGRWRAAGARVVVLSNWDISLHHVLGRLSLAPLTDAILTSAEAGARKPDPAIFARALTLAGARPEQTVHIGDSLEEDVAGARAAGIEPVLLSRDGELSGGGVRRITSLADWDPPGP
jgi:putative hydrolase of the HAD superfamily